MVPESESENHALYYKYLTVDNHLFIIEHQLYSGSTFYRWLFVSSSSLVNQLLQQNASQFKKSDQGHRAGFFKSTIAQSMSPGESG